MVQFEQTFRNFIMRHQENYNRSYHFLILMDAIITAATRIELNYRTGALKDNLGASGSTNVHGEKVLQMDEIAHNIVVHYLNSSERVIQAVSEESEEIITMNKDGGRYFIYFDPLDGSSNVAHGLPVGFMFGIAKRNFEGNIQGPEDFHLRAGNEFIASGMFVIPTGMFTLALRDAGCWRFHADETNTYVKPTRMMLPEDSKKWELSFNSANTYTFGDNVQEWIRENEKKFTFRYLGALAGDFHRLLSNGGMFMYPAIVNHPDEKKNRPQGKLRLMYEANVVAMMCKEAGGAAVNEAGDSILDIKPEKHHQRTAIYVGSKPMIEDITKTLKK
jgi:fructose-1,6-bisphosphatase I